MQHPIGSPSSDVEQQVALLRGVLREGDGSGRPFFESPSVNYPRLLESHDGSAPSLGDVAPPVTEPSPAPAQAPGSVGEVLLARWYNDVELFAWEVFGLQLWSKQRLIARLVASTSAGNIRLAVASGHKTGKALALDTPIPTPDGWSTMGDLQVGDLVFDENSAPCRIVAVTEVMHGRPCYDVEFSDGTVITADEEHEWLTTCDDITSTRTTGEIARSSSLHAVTNTAPITCPDTGRTFEGQREIVAVRPRASVPVRCIQVDSPSSLYLASRAFIPTHNSKMLAVIAIWWAITRPAGRAIITAPTARQIRDTLWREIKSLYDAAKKTLKDTFGIQNGIGGKLNELPDAGLRFPDGSQVLGFSTNSPERMAGTSGKHLLYLIDEASGIEQPIFDAIEGNRAGGASMVMFSNPTRTTGYFFEAFHGRNKALWHRIRISSEETPNVVARRQVVPGLALLSYIMEKQSEWGPDWKTDPRYQVRILGQFPSTSSNQVVPFLVIERGKKVWYQFAAAVLGRPELVEKSSLWKDIVKNHAELLKVRERWIATSEGPLILGVDPAWEGDDLTTIYVRRGRRMFVPHVMKHGKGAEVRDAVLEIVRRYRRGMERPKCRIDALGVGVSAVEHLRECTEVQLIEVQSMKRSNIPEEFRNLRAEILFSAARWLEDHGGFEPDAELERDLGAPTYHLNGVGQCEVESKTFIKRRLGRSPDRGDAFSLCSFESTKNTTRVLSPQVISNGLSSFAGSSDDPDEPSYQHLRFTDQERGF